MIEKRSQHIFKPLLQFPFVLLIAVVFLLGGCSMTMYQPYAGDDGRIVEGSTLYDGGNFSFMLPPGWKKTEDFDLTKDSIALKLFASGSSVTLFKKSDITLMMITCVENIAGGTAGYESLVEGAESSVNGFFPDNELTMGPYELLSGGGSLKPAFALYKGISIEEGMELPFRIYSGWKGGFGLGCHFEVFAFTLGTNEEITDALDLDNRKLFLDAGFTMNNKDILDEFLSVLRTLKAK